MNIYCYKYEAGRAVLCCGVVDDFISCNFTRSFSGIGEWQIVISNYSNGVEYLRTANFIKLSDGVCGLVNTISTDNETTTIKGVELKGLASTRIVMPPDGKSYQAYTNKSPEYVIAELINLQIINSNSKRQIDGTIAAYDEQSTRIAYNGRFGNVGEEIATIATANAVGWYANIEEDQIVWHITHGLDRTAEQETNNRFIISYALDNINASTLEYNKFTTNTAIVAGQGEGVDRTVVLLNDANSGLSRVETYIDARDVEVDDELEQRGQEKLAAYGTDISYDCEAGSTLISQYRNGFELGDVGTLIDDVMGVSANFQLSEVEEVYENNMMLLHITFGNNTQTLTDALKRIETKTESLIKSEGSSGGGGVSGDYVAKSGDTMTGTLKVPNFIIGQTGNDYASFNLLDGSGKFASLIGYNGDAKTLTFQKAGTNYSDASPYVEVYSLPSSGELDSNEYYDVLTSKNVVRIDQGGTGSYYAWGALDNLGGVHKSGDTMTGNLSIEGNLYPSLKLTPTYNNTTNHSVFEGSYTGATSFSSWNDYTGNNRRMLEVRNSNSSSTLDNAAVLRDVRDGSYYTYRVFHAGMNTPVPVANGGTGSNNAATALSNLGGVAKSGDTMTGTLKVPYAIIQPSSGWPTVELMTTAGEKMGAFQISTNTNRLNLQQRATGATYSENYLLPERTEDLTADSWYDILTTKKVITLAQGGTGARDAATARTNLGIVYSDTQPTNPTEGMIWIFPA